MTESQAFGLAKAIGGIPHHTGGGLWVVLFHRPNGEVVEIGDDGANVYRNLAHYGQGWQDDDRPEQITWEVAD